MGLRGTVPSAGADLLGAGTYYLPIQESEGGTGGRGDGALISEEFRSSGVAGVQEFKGLREESCSVGAKSF